MSYAIRIHAKLEQDFASIPIPMQDRIMVAIRSLTDSPRPPGSKKLSGVKPNIKNVYRVRVGDYRVGYQIFDRELVVFVITAAERGKIYPQLKRRLKK